ncbi:hypothetical protein B4135_2762 [Caldibacillus debilis]|uniref:Uncharacterized protein n=1 Tax=Caldibacillus debilis TaxID=301148 RepID=A0A150LPX5_9BACI|nr:hypothetical protein B4135_2762 [Caldibacillus debilis]
MQFSSLSRTGYDSHGSTSSRYAHLVYKFCYFHARAIIFCHPPCIVRKKLAIIENDNILCGCCCQPRRRLNDPHKFFLRFLLSLCLRAHRPEGTLQRNAGFIFLIKKRGNGLPSYDSNL